MSDIKTFELSGWVCLKGGDHHGEPKDVFLEKKLPEDKSWYYPDVDSVGEEIQEHFSKIVKPIHLSYEDWTRGSFVAYKDVFLRYYVSPVEITWDEAVEGQIRSMSGEMQTESRATGYSEYTVTDKWYDLFVGGHDLRRELSGHEGKYVLIKIDYKV